MIDFKKLIKYSEKGILSKELEIGEEINLTLFCMGKGTEISDHTSTKNGFIYVIEGKGIFNLKGKEIKMLPNVLISFKKKAIHSLKVEKDTSFLLFLFNLNERKKTK